MYILLVNGYIVYWENIGFLCMHAKLCNTDFNFPIAEVFLPPVPYIIKII